MKVTVRIALSFKRQAKLLLKKYPSLIRELSQLESDLKEDPRMGTPLGKILIRYDWLQKAKTKVKAVD